MIMYFILYYSPSLEGKYSELGSGRRGAPSSDRLCLYICHLEWGLYC